MIFGLRKISAIGQPARAGNLNDLASGKTDCRPVPGDRDRRHRIPGSPDEQMPVAVAAAFL
jgi:hypothetical protein